jgi:diguanylate cyclase (GGDEF)-like protein
VTDTDPASSRSRAKPALQSTSPALAERLVDAVQALSLARDLPAIQHIVRHAARSLLKSDGATFVLREDGNCYYADEDAIAPLWKGQRFPMDSCISGWCIRNGDHAVAEDIYKDPRIPAEAYRPTFVKSLAMVPIRKRDPLGAIGVYWARRHRAGVSELKLLQALADSTAVAMENVALFSDLEDRVRQRTQALEAAYEEIQQLALRDDLTGLYNRRGFFVLSEQQRKRAARTGLPTFIVFIDVDGLKQVNDRLGHQAGDELLLNAARILRSTFRESDIVARLGGDEFCIFTSDCTGAPERIAARLEHNVNAFNSNRPDSPHPLSLSFGIHRFDADNPLPLSQLVGCADDAMYAHKRERSLRAN